MSAPSRSCAGSGAPSSTRARSGAATAPPRHPPLTRVRRRALYERRWLTSAIVEGFAPGKRTWRQVYADRCRVEFGLRAADAPATPQPLTYERCSAAADLLRRRAEESAEAAELSLQVAGECLASALAVRAGDFEARLKLGQTVAALARMRDGAEAARLFGEACAAYAQAAVPAFCLHESVLRYWGDALLDFSRKKEGAEAEALLEAACGKYAEAIRVNSRYSLAYYYYGRALKLLARLRKLERPHDADRLFREACERLARAGELRQEDAYVIYEHAGTLHDYALMKDAEGAPGDADALLSQAVALYADAHAIMPSDGWILRNWADTLYDKAKIAYSRLRDAGDEASAEAVAPVLTLLASACAKYEESLALNPAYTNALNSWGLALSTYAKVTLDEQVSENFFALAYARFERAIAMHPEDANTEVCNWAMTLASHALKRERVAQAHARAGTLSTLSPPGRTPRELIREAKRKLAPLVERQDGWAYFCLARIYAVARREHKSREWLVRCVEKGYVRRATKWQLDYFANVRHAPWYTDLLARERRPPAAPAAAAAPATITP